MKNFSDVPKGAWYFRALQEAVELGIITGYEDGTFRPNAPITRAESLALQDKEYYSLNRIMDKVNPAVVTITGYGSGMGSGYFVRPDTVITNMHVAMLGCNSKGELDNIKVVLPDGRELKAYIPYGDGARDCAVLRVPAQNDITPVNLATEYTPYERCYCVGAPLGLMNSVSKGIVSALRVFVSYDQEVKWLQTDAAINPGNSGGVLVDRIGNVIGMPSWKIFWSGEKEARPIEGLGFALHYEEILETMKIADGISSGTKIVNLPKKHEKITAFGGLYSVWG